MVYLKPKRLIIDCARRFVLKLYRHEASRGLFATAELLVHLLLKITGFSCHFRFAWSHVTLLTDVTKDLSSYNLFAVGLVSRRVDVTSHAIG